MSRPSLRARQACLLARRGLPIFPVVANGKLPALAGWQQEATTDCAKITKWFEGNPNLNVGVSTNDFLVIDLDNKKGGLEAWKAFLADHIPLDETLPETLGQSTWSGGIHLIFSLPAGIQVGNSVERLGPGIDVRGRGGLIVGAGSEIDGRPYCIIGSNESFDGEAIPKIAQAPQWLIEACRRARPKTENAGQRIAPETEGTIAHAWARMEKWPASDDPDAGDDAAYRHAAELGDIGVEKETALEIMDAWNERLDDPLDDERLAQKVENAYKYHQGALGRKSPDYSGFPPDYDTKPKKPHDAKLYYLTADQSAAKALTHAAEPLIDGLLDVGAMSVIYGESNSGKSFVEMDKDFHIASGTPYAKRAVKQGPVVWIAAEGGAGVHKRVKAWLQKHGKLDKGVPFYVIPCPVDLRHGDVDVGPLLEMIAEISEKAGAPIVKITIDTLSRVMTGGDENSPVDMGFLVKHFDKLRAETGAHVAVIHHSGKDMAKGARGHSLLRAATDTEIEVHERRIQVKKQRDLDADVWFRFELPVTQVGLDERSGKVVDSCTVRITTQTEAQAEDAAKQIETAETAQAKFIALIIRHMEGSGRTEFFQSEASDWYEADLGTPKKDLHKKVAQKLNDLGNLGNLGNSGRVGLNARVSGRKLLYSLEPGQTWANLGKSKTPS